MPFLGLSLHTGWARLKESCMNHARLDYFRKVRLTKTAKSRRRPSPLLRETKLEALRIDELRLAIRANQVSFPSPVPTFGRHDRADLQWKLAQLYFVLGWNCEGIAAKYGLIHQRVRQILKTWKRRAVETGYIQFIPPADVPHSIPEPA
jgi:hypothetical protein